MRIILFLQILFYFIWNFSFAAEKVNLELLANTKEWKSLIYSSDKNSLLFDLADQDLFYLSQTKIFSPLNELKETLTFFRSKNIDTERGHPYCLYPARKMFLENKGFKFDDKITCDGLSSWLELLKLDEIQIIYASQFLGNPASVMGHTFLKFVDRSNPDFANDSIGYAANVDDGVGAFEYAYNGLFGGFKGVFSRSPYYEKVHEYNNMERRDIWEYTLKLNNEQKQKFALKIWELKHSSRFKYYFFSKNCSYLPIAVLQGVFFDSKILDELSLYVVPHETIKALDRHGLIEKTKYRPSIRTKLRTRFKRLNSKGKEKVLNSIKEKRFEESISVEELDTLIDYTYLRRYLNDGVVPDELKSLEQNLLLNRSLLEIKSEDPVYSSTDPIESEGIFHLEAGAFTSGSLDALKVTFRPGIHSYMDKDVSYLRNSSFSFLELHTIYDGKSFFLNELTFLDIVNNNPSLSIDNSFSWGMNIGLKKSLYEYSYGDSHFAMALQFGREKDIGTNSYFQYYLISNIFNGEGFYSRNNFQYGTKLAFGTYSTKTYKVELGIKLLRNELRAFYDNKVYLKSSVFSFSDCLSLKFEFEYSSLYHFDDEFMGESSLVWSF